MRHKAIIDRFGRYPHRHEVLGREFSRQGNTSGNKYKSIK
ncbi:DUF924 family protein [Nitrincola iocasae]|nr:DUF924 family protein [Nitrincola iocasae]